MPDENPKLLVTLDCSDRGCPAIYELNDEAFLVQGYKAAGILSSEQVPDSEDVVRIPKKLLRQLLEAHPSL